MPYIWKSNNVSNDNTSVTVAIFSAEGALWNLMLWAHFVDKSKFYFLRQDFQSTCLLPPPRLVKLPETDQCFSFSNWAHLRFHGAKETHRERTSEQARPFTNARVAILPLPVPHTGPQLNSSPTHSFPLFCLSRRHLTWETTEAAF